MQGKEVVIPLGHAEDEEDEVKEETTQRVLVAKDSGLISDEAYHELRMIYNIKLKKRHTRRN